MKPVWLVHGKKRSGKGTIADYLIFKHNFQRVKLSQALKSMVGAFLQTSGFDPVTIERCIETDLKEMPLAALGGKSARYAMQKIGSEWRDLIDQKLWSNLTMYYTKNILNQNGKVVIDDIRFSFELDFFNSLDTYRCIVLRDHIPNELPVENWKPPVNSSDFFDLNNQALNAMVSALLLQACIPSEQIEDYINKKHSFAKKPIDILSGYCANDIYISLNTSWRGFMSEPWCPTLVPTNTHFSENSINQSEFDLIAKNNSTLKCLYEQIDNAIENI